jgi:cytochrome c-type biogenesis protein CcmF
MRQALGSFSLTLAASAAFVGVCLLVAGIVRHDRKLIGYGRRCVWIVLGASIGSIIAMQWALNTHDYSIDYVYRNVANATPRLFTITALWGALEGSILLWGFVLALYMGATALRFRSRADDPLVAWATAVQLLVALFFFVLMLGPADPFKATVGIVTPLDGNGPNALLQNHPLMAFHPPMLYAGYVGFTIPFSFAIAALVTGRFGEGWLADTRRATLVAWGFLTIGIVLGAWWSYEVLGWGGYWAWDPVENASLLPWLTATAFIHSVMVQERRGMLRVWNLSLVVATFALTILGTFLTRSGVIDSVHAFSESEIGVWLLTFLGVVVVGALGLIAWRGDALRTPGRIDSPLSREAAFLFNNLLFAGFALVVLIGTVYPLLVEALRDERLTVGEPYFRSMTTPIGIGLLFLMSVAPVLPWRATSGEVLRDRLLVPAAVGVATMALIVVLGGEGIAQVAAFGLGAFCVSGIVRNFAVSLRARRRARGEALPVAVVRLVRGNPRVWGGLVVHLGVVILGVAIAASSGYATRREAQLATGDSVIVRDYRVTYLGSVELTSAQKNTVKARLRVERDGDDLGVYAPAISSFPNARSAIGTPSVRTGWREDVYLSLSSSEDDQGKIGITVGVNPLVLWLWIGGGVMGLGTLVCLVPKRREAQP